MGLIRMGGGGQPRPSTDRSVGFRRFLQAASSPCWTMAASTQMVSSPHQASDQSSIRHNQPHIGPIMACLRERMTPIELPCIAERRVDRAWPVHAPQLHAKEGRTRRHSNSGLHGAAGTKPDLSQINASI